MVLENTTVANFLKPFPLFRSCHSLKCQLYLSSKKVGFLTKYLISFALGFLTKLLDI